VKRIYGLGEKQFRLYFSRAERQQGKTGDNLLIMLERRLDNVVYRSGFASSRAQARQLIGHGHLRVDGTKVDVASFQVKSGNVVAVREKSRKNPYILESLDIAKSRGCPKWLELDGEKFQSTVKELPQREDVSTIPIQEQLIVELYSK
jgi:small subunit ribosomal protein S4